MTLDFSIQVAHSGGKGGSCQSNLSLYFLACSMSAFENLFLLDGQRLFSQLIIQHVLEAEVY
jgi:hypothetical protein